MDDCIFCKIVAGEAPCHKIWEDERHLAFLSIFPNTEGFSVVVTKGHYPSNAFDVPLDVYSGLAHAARETGRRIDAAFEDVGRTGLIMEGMGVNHLHAKLFPMHGVSKAGEWKPAHSHVEKTFATYEGYLSSHNGPRALEDELARVALKIRTTRF